ncbi:hypothetical protein GGR53DRAFT_471974 [Hypoxylon sp. FL1150]|nr:hypothetical protein GGR53DRAFT_471974 [Hypoxylon sp. FL1150]
MRNSPRGLIEHEPEHEQYDRARASLYWLREGSLSEEQVDAELAHAVEDVEGHRSRVHGVDVRRHRHKVPSSDAIREARPAQRVTLMAGGIESTLQSGMTVIEMFLINLLGRRVTLTAGCVAMGLGTLVYPDNTNSVADVICIAFIFIYALGYNLHGIIASARA